MRNLGKMLGLRDLLPPADPLGGFLTPSRGLPRLCDEEVFLLGAGLDALLHPSRPDAAAGPHQRRIFRIAILGRNLAPLARPTSPPPSAPRRLVVAGFE